MWNNNSIINQICYKYIKIKCFSALVLRSAHGAAAGVELPGPGPLPCPAGGPGGPPTLPSTPRGIQGAHIHPKKNEVGFIFAWSGSELWSLFKYSRVKFKKSKPLAVDVLFKGYPMVPLSCRSNLAERYLEKFSLRIMPPIHLIPLKKCTIFYGWSV